MALAESGDWEELEKLSKTKKPPLGMEVSWGEVSPTPFQPYGFRENL